MSSVELANPRNWAVRAILILVEMMVAIAGVIWQTRFHPTPKPCDRYQARAHESLAGASVCITCAGQQQILSLYLPTPCISPSIVKAPGCQCACCGGGSSGHFSLRSEALLAFSEDQPPPRDDVLERVAARTDALRTHHCSAHFQFLEVSELIYLACPAHFATSAWLVGPAFAMTYSSLATRRDLHPISPYFAKPLLQDPSPCHR
mmetsp:Transcript_120074/g.190159  ORF Transcript_120074/g.190159 Transcript_120074/m.190159 type:complete len:205 (+) Transcript_120074:836-1450(+)